MEIDNTSDTLDVRDIIERYEELEDLLAEKDTDDANDEDALEFKKLGEWLKEVEGCGGDEEWRGNWYPITLIHRDYFEDYARELASDVVEGYDDRNTVWPYTYIDWEAAAEALEMDYTSVSLDGEGYLCR